MGWGRRTPAGLGGGPLPPGKNLKIQGNKRGGKEQGEAPGRLREEGQARPGEDFPEEEEEGGKSNFKER